MSGKLVWVARKRCGCIVGAEVDDNDQHKLAANDILDWTRQGYTVSLEQGPVTILNCSEHRRLATLNKVKDGTSGKMVKILEKDQLTLVIKPFLVGFAGHIKQLADEPDYNMATSRLADLLVENYGKW